MRLTRASIDCTKGRADRPAVLRSRSGERSWIVRSTTTSRRSFWTLTPPARWSPSRPHASSPTPRPYGSRPSRKRRRPRLRSPESTATISRQAHCRELGALRGEADRRVGRRSRPDGAARPQAGGDRGPGDLAGRPAAVAEELTALRQTVAGEFRAGRERTLSNCERSCADCSSASSWRPIGQPRPATRSARGSDPSGFRMGDGTGRLRPQTALSEWR